MIDASDAALAQLSLAAYTPGSPLPAGFTPVPDAAVAGSIDPTARYVGGSFTDGNSAALVSTGPVDGVNSLVIAFRGSDDREDSLNSLSGINADYADFADLIAWADAYAASGAVSRVVVTGHSLGGSLAQQYMATHADGVTGITYASTTFGSPGAQLAAVADARIDNVVVADDPAVVLGTHRGEIGSLLAADPSLADAAAQRVAEEFPGITRAEALATLPTLTANYVNRGDIVLLPGDDGSFNPGSFTGLLEANADRHDPALYASLTASAAAGTASTVVVPELPTNDAEAIGLGVYGGRYPTGVNVSGAIEDVVDAWSFGSGVVDDVENGVDDVVSTVEDAVEDVTDFLNNDFDLF